MPNMKHLIAYRRVSTQQQGESGLGMDSQEQSILGYAMQTGSHLAATYDEIESGKNSARPMLAKAMAHAKRIKGILLIAKLDRLARNSLFINQLLASGVEFVCCDMPFAHKLTIQILAAVAEHEAEQISARVKAALAQAKKRGVLLGTHRPGHFTGTYEQHVKNAKHAYKFAISARKEISEPIYNEVRPIIRQMRDSGDTLLCIATHLNANGYRTARDKQWNAMQVRRVLLT
jgi:DNA invertase Pin-like site-specific DNA recombinase